MNNNDTRAPYRQKDSDTRCSEEYFPLIEQARQEIHRVLVGQEEMLDRLLIALLTEGHLLLEGVPGIAKTLMVRCLSRVLNLDFQRIQFTPDLLPADIMGTMMYNQKELRFEVTRGPVFTNILLADEINRAPAKVQSALLQAMQEKEVSIGRETHSLPTPFFVAATQNPIEQEGTYPLPEAQLDRFMMKVLVSYPTSEEEQVILQRMTRVSPPLNLKSIINRSALSHLKSMIDTIYVDDKIRDYVIRLVRATRKPGEYNLPEIEERIEFGASPRASVYLCLAAKGYALLQQRNFVLPEDIKAVAKDVLRHRIIMSYEALADEITPDQILDVILNEIEVP